ncbi:hypothetical protein GCM10027280_06670 [Micromonospora polyrhachis]|uniref:Uncharacterized protein n=1 Tax=Micromonospora polyrhachis TaxID=1282883 RepID=A0A7W7SKF2_9ACTN|nr:hypothetical protein [Micromonospora polyrhachis]MBB4956422.1 hypothetical protein [Micromonospora polyrhachis]
MSASRIEFSGEALARRVPLLGQFQSDLEETVKTLVDIAACRWADDAPGDDKVTLQARKAVRDMLVKYVFPSYTALGGAVGLQGEKLDVVRRIGDNTEASNAEAAGGWGGGHRG